MSCPSGSYTVSTVGAIADSAFRNCDSLTSVIIGDSVTSIGERAFYGCGKLDYVVYAGLSVPGCGSFVFTSMAVSSVHVVSEYSGSSMCGTGVSRDYVAPSGCSARERLACALV